MLVTAFEGEFLNDFATKIINIQKENISNEVIARFNGLEVKVSPDWTKDSFIYAYNLQWDIRKNK